MTYYVLARRAEPAARWSCIDRVDDFADAFAVSTSLSSQEYETQVVHASVLTKAALKTYEDEIARRRCKAPQ